MKGTGLRLVAVVVFLLVFAGANVGAFLLGRASMEYTVSWEDTEVFYAEILERRENSFLVEGLSVNDVNHQGQFTFAAEADTRLLWNGAEISLEDLQPGQRVAITYSGDRQEIYPVSLPEVYQVLLLEDKL